MMSNRNEAQLKRSTQLRGTLGSRRRVRYGVCFVAVVAGLAIWLTRISIAAHSQKSAVASLTSLGAHIEYDFEELGLNKPSGWPAWLIDTFGVDYFANVVTVDGFGNNTGDADLISIQTLTRLRQINLANTQITDDGLIYIRGLKALEYLDLRQTEITDAGLVHLAALRALTTLDISEDRVSDLGMATLQHLKNLQSLYVNGTRIHDNGLAYIRDLDAMKSLDLSNTEVTDAGLFHLAAMKAIKFLELRQTQITDTGLVQLGKITNLETLDLGNTRITDRGLGHLKRLTLFGKLVLIRTAVTDAGATLLQRALPHCDIVYGPPRRISSLAIKDRRLALYVPRIRCSSATVVDVGTGAGNQLLTSRGRP